MPYQDLPSNPEVAPAALVVKPANRLVPLIAGLALVVIIIGGSVASVLVKRKAITGVMPVTSSAKGYVATVSEGSRVVANQTAPADYAKYTIAPTEFIVPADLTNEYVQAAYFTNMKPGNFYTASIIDEGVMAIDLVDPLTQHETLSSVEALNPASVPFDTPIYRTTEDGSVAMIRVSSNVQQITAMIWGKGKVWRVAAAYGSTMTAQSVLTTIDNWKASTN